MFYMTATLFLYLSEHLSFLAQTVQNMIFPLNTPCSLKEKRHQHVWQQNCLNKIEITGPK